MTHSDRTHHSSVTRRCARARCHRAHRSPVPQHATPLTSQPSTSSSGLEWACGDDGNYSLCHRGIRDQGAYHREHAFLLQADLGDGSWPPVHVGASEKSDSEPAAEPEKGLKSRTRDWTRGCVGDGREGLGRRFSRPIISVKPRNCSGLSDAPLCGGQQGVPARGRGHGDSIWASTRCSALRPSLSPSAEC